VNHNKAGCHIVETAKVNIKKILEPVYMDEVVNLKYNSAKLILVMANPLPVAKYLALPKVISEINEFEYIWQTNTSKRGENDSKWCTNLAKAFHTPRSKTS